MQIVRRFIRESAFELARRDLAHFLDDNEDKLLRIFREEMKLLDDSIPEENLFIDIHMVALGETILEAVLHTIRRFLLEEITDEDVIHLATEKGASKDVPIDFSKS